MKEKHNRSVPALNNYDIERLEKCFRCGAPSLGFVQAEHDDAPPLSTLQAIVLKEAADVGGA